VDYVLSVEIIESSNDVSRQLLNLPFGERSGIWVTRHKFASVGVETHNFTKSSVLKHKPTDEKLNYTRLSPLFFVDDFVQSDNVWVV
jgi:hypothetical protein